MFGLMTYAGVVASLLLVLWKYPAVGLAGVLCMFGLEQWGQATNTFFSQHQSATNYLIGGILVLALTLQTMKKGLSLFAGYPSVGWLTLVLFLYAFASTQWASRPDISMAEWGSRLPYVVTILLLSPLIICEIRDLRSTYTALFLIGGVLTVLLLFFVKWEARRIVLGNSIGDQGFGNPLAIAGMAGMVAIVGILANPWPQSKAWLPFKWTLVALCLILIVRSGSRAQLLGVIVISAACWPISRPIKDSKQFFAWTFGVLFLSGITVLALGEFWSKQEAYYAGGNRWSEQAMQGAMSGRFDMALYLVNLWYSAPETIFFGLGNSTSFDPRILGIYPHFVPLEILAEEGLVGIILFLTILYMTGRNALRGYRSVRSVPSDRPIFAALVAMFLYASLLALKQGSLLGNLEPFMFAIILGKHSRIFPEKEVVSDSLQASTPTPTQERVGWAPQTSF